MVVGFTTTYAISAYHHRCEFQSRSGRGVQHYLLKFVCDLRQVGRFLQVFRFQIKEVWFGFMVFSATFNNISVMLCRLFIGGGKRSTQRTPLLYDIWV
jgi:hypothetical protein